MNRIYKKLEIACAHNLTLPYESKCKEVHGHNYVIEIWICSPKLNTDGMILDFAAISELVKHYDHKLLNDFLPQPTAENFANLLRDRIKASLQPSANVRIKVWETSTSFAEVYPDGDD